MVQLGEGVWGVLAKMSTLDHLYQAWPQTPCFGDVREVPDVTREDLAQLFADLNFNRGVEIGTEYGLYAETLCKANPNLFLSCVDPYKAYPAYRDHKTQAKLDGIYEQAQTRLAPYKVEFDRDFSVPAYVDYETEDIDFVYIDGNHTLFHVIQDLTYWSPVVRKGGIIAGHDYIRRNNSLRYQCHVVEAVHAYVQCYMIKPLFIVGAKEQQPGIKRDAIRSFFWIKQ